MPASSKLAANDLDLIEKLGRSAYGEVWKGKWKRPGGTIFVGIKKLPVIGQTEVQRNIIVRDIDALSTISNEYILQIYGALCVGLEVWVVTEFMEGRSLFDLLHSEEPIVWTVRLRLAYQAACSVHALHSNEPSILHRDIKSSNFWVSTDCSTLKMIDFGLSKIITVISDVPRALESPRWGAPETLEYPPKWSPEADIYSLGFTFYEIATRKIPFFEVDDAHLKSMAESPERPSLPEGCPEELAAIIRSCWDHVPKNRPTSEQVLQALTLATARSTLTPLPRSFSILTSAESMPNSLRNSVESDTDDPLKISDEIVEDNHATSSQTSKSKESKLKKTKSEKQVKYKKENEEVNIAPRRKNSIQIQFIKNWFKGNKNPEHHKPAHYGFSIRSFGRKIKRSLIGKGAKLQPVPNVDRISFNLSPRTKISLLRNSSVEFRNQSWVLNASVPELQGEEGEIYSGLEQLMMLKRGEWEEGVSVVKDSLRQFFVIPASAKNSFALKLLGEGIERVEFDRERRRLTLHDANNQIALVYHRPIYVSAGGNKKGDADVTWNSESGELVVLHKNDIKLPLILAFIISQELIQIAPPGDKKGKGMERQPSKKQHNL